MFTLDQAGLVRSNRYGREHFEGTGDLSLVRRNSRIIESFPINLVQFEEEVPYHKETISNYIAGLFEGFLCNRAGLEGSIPTKDRPVILATSIPLAA